MSVSNDLLSSATSMTGFSSMCTASLLTSTLCV